MKQGRRIDELVAEVQRQAAVKRDFLVDTRKIAYRADNNRMALMSDGELIGLEVSEHAHRQIRGRLEIPAKFYERLRKDHPELLEANVNTLFQREPEPRMLRALDGELRAFLSNGYRPIDYDEMLAAALPVLTGFDGMEVVSAQVTETRLYVKFTIRSLERAVAKVGDVVRAGGVISNSEVGAGALYVADMDYTLACLNGMTREKVLRSAHLGKRLDVGDGREFFKDETRRADDQVILMKLRDTLEGMFKPERFEQRMQKLDGAVEDVIEQPLKTVEVVRERFDLSEALGERVLTKLLSGPVVAGRSDLNRYGLANALTLVAQEVDGYEEATQLEELGGKVIELEKSEWQAITTEAAQKAA